MKFAGRKDLELVEPEGALTNELIENIPKDVNCQGPNFWSLPRKVDVYAHRLESIHGLWIPQIHDKKYCIESEISCWRMIWT